MSIIWRLPWLIFINDILSIELRRLLYRLVARPVGPGPIVALACEAYVPLLAGRAVRRQRAVLADSGALEAGLGGAAILHELLVLEDGARGTRLGYAVHVAEATLQVVYCLIGLLAGGEGVLASLSVATSLAPAVAVAVLYEQVVGPRDPAHS